MNEGAAAIAAKATKKDNRHSEPAGGRTLHRFGGSLAKKRENGNPTKPVVPAQTRRQHGGREPRDTTPHDVVQTEGNCMGQTTQLCQ